MMSSRFFLQTRFKQWQSLSIALFTAIVLLGGCACQSSDSPPSESKAPATLKMLTPEMLDASLAVGRQFLLLNQTSAGNFHYEYDFLSKKMTRGDSQVRQAGATWGIASIHRTHPSDLTHAALAHAFQFFNDHSVLTDDGRRYIVYPGDPKGRTGTVALVSLALIEFIQTLPGGAERTDTEELLGQYMRFLLSMRQDDGPYKGRFHGSYDHETGRAFGKPSPYFDGEGLLAMAKACRYAGMADLQEKILESADVMHRAYVTDAWKIDPDSDLTKGFYQWSSMAFFEIHMAGWAASDRYALWTIELAHWMIDEHRTLRRKKNASYAHEGLISAWELSRVLGQKKAQAKIGRVIDQALSKLTSWQVGGPNQNEFLQEYPTKDLLAMGGVMNSKEDPKLRIDVAQHQMHAVILARRYIYKNPEGQPERPLPSVPSGPQNLLWTELGPPLAIEPNDAQSCLQEIWRVLQLDVQVPLNLPEKLSDDSELRIVFLSVGGENQPAKVAVGHGRGIREAVAHAVTKARHMIPDHANRKIVRLDVVQLVGLRELVRPNGPLRLNAGRDGFLLISKTPAAFHPWEIISQGLIDSRDRLRLENVILYLGQYQGQRGAAEGGLTTPRLIRPFRTTSYFYDGEQFKPLFRGHAVPQEITPQSLLQSLEIAGRYLTGSVGPDGHMVYTYNPATAEQPTDYNILRHAGTTFAMFDLYKTTKDPKLLAAAQRARKFLLEQVLPWPKEGADAAVVAYNRKIKLGGAALAIIALVSEIQASGNREYLPLAQKLARYISQQQQESGEFISQRWQNTGKARDFVSVYYPGEALLALVRLYSVDKDPKWLDVAQRGARYLIKDRDADLPTKKLPHDHWLLYALNELHRERPEPFYLDHARRIVESMYLKQRRSTSPPDHLGTFYNPPRTTPTATRAEGMIAAYKLFEDYGTPAEAQRTLEMAHLAIFFQLQTQFQIESAMLVDDPQRCLGAFHSGLTNFEIRNDYVQHNISAILELYRLMQLKKIELLGQADWKSTKLIEKARAKMSRSLSKSAAADALPMGK
jgi:hypothetical protein